MSYKILFEPFSLPFYKNYQQLSGLKIHRTAKLTKMGLTRDSDIDMNPRKNVANIWGMMIFNLTASLEILLNKTNL